MRLIEKIVAFVFLVMVILNIPSVVLFTYSSTVSAYLSYLMIFSGFTLTIFGISFFPPLLKSWYLVCILFFLFTLLNYDGAIAPWIIQVSKYTALLFGSYRAIMVLRNRDMYWMFVIGGIFIFLDAFYFHWNISMNEAIYGNGRTGRYAGLYINANSAGAAMLFGLLVSYKEIGYYKTLGLLVCSLAGLLSLSRSFMLTLLIYLILSIRLSPKYIVYTLLFGVFVRFLTPFTDLIDLRVDRVELLLSFIQHGTVSSSLFSGDSRSSLLLDYLDLVIDNLFVGNGFDSFRSGEMVSAGLGVHNTYAMVLGEGGVFPFMLFMAFLGYLFVKSISNFDFQSVKFKTMLLVLIQFMISHTFFEIPFRILLFSFLIFTLKNERNGTQITN